MSGERKDISFNHPTLEQVHFHINDDFLPDEFNGFENMDYTIKIKELNQNNEKVEKSLISFHLTLGGKDIRYPFEISITYKAIFEWTNQSEIEKNDFLKINAPAILYSYCRPVISNLTGYSGFPPLDLPFYNFTKEEN
ncbi:protein-export chaperone SecB [Macrococcoides bohemicum]|uniref:protein-export chaperone SecB n=1 Tax=Macrococcoides bohemicum TaxID=1903056 RepID=UPI0014050759|nr:protein-export chaperone SecB [Macrococcus bohemicus]